MNILSLSEEIIIITLHPVLDPFLPRDAIICPCEYDTTLSFDYFYLDILWQHHMAFQPYLDYKMQVVYSPLLYL